MTNSTFRIRRPSLNDAQAVCDLVAACDTEDLGAPDIVLDDVLDMWSRFDLDNNVWIVEDRDSALVGYAFLEEDSEEKLFSYGCVLPAARGRGVGATLVKALEARASELRNATGVPKRLQSMIPTLCEDAVRLFEAQGYAPVRYFKRMGIRLETEPAPAIPPEGFTLEPFMKGRDEQAVYEAYVESFADHWDFTAPPFEKWAEKTLLPTFEERWWLIARDSKGDVAGFALSRMRDDLLFIEQIGVRRPFRGRGLALALLQCLFGASYHAGQMLVSLGVDAANPSGAYRLYEQAGMKSEYAISIYEKPFTLSSE
ncbi:GNAT family N-acetyltransferase [Paenibacillus jilunlii]|uniref:GNAT family acetyltransferase n=1 Tax=Paenibacillus jilunlii TaxID=682956 RepID=A0A1G9KUT0_9BACL|nr:GNAT family N-acetyltransferase [Paenibacillus jilunlii]KWX69819.1 GNAT family acetyltransferase [Paenibacillus jilunlii]SDL53442.1 mycothiol synthase [Paenibacillus jilunlii]